MSSQRSFMLHRSTPKLKIYWSVSEIGTFPPFKVDATTDNVDGQVGIWKALLPYGTAELKSCARIRIQPVQLLNEISNKFKQNKINISVFIDITCNFQLAIIHSNVLARTTCLIYMYTNTKIIKMTQGMINFYVQLLIVFICFLKLFENLIGFITTASESSRTFIPIHIWLKDLWYKNGLVL